MQFCHAHPTAPEPDASQPLLPPVPPAALTIKRRSLLSSLIPVPTAIVSGTYDPLLPDGPAAEHLVGFGRRHESGALLVVVPRLLVSLVPDDPPPTGEGIWTTRRIHLPDTCEARRAPSAVDTSDGPGPREVS
jgi:hypothetical protein